MSDQNGSTAFRKENVDPSGTSTVDKGKGKAAEPASHEMSLDEDDSSSDDEVDETAAVADEPDDDNMEEIDTDNIIRDGRRTRGRKIDFAKAAEEHPEEDDEDEDDDDFEDGDDEDRMEE